MDFVVGGVIQKGDKFLLVQESKKQFYKKWNLPAGHLENNETIFEGAEREIFEETGFKTKVNGIIQISNIKNLFFGIIFSVDILSVNNEFNKDEILDVKWFTYEEIINMKDDLRDARLTIDAIELKLKNKIIPLENIKIIDGDNNE